VLLIAGIIFGLHNIDVGSYEAAAAMFGLSVTGLIGILLNLKGKYYPTAIIVTVITILVNYYNYYDGISLYDPGITAIPIIIIFTAFLLGRKSIPYITAANLAGLLLIIYFERAGIITPPNLTSNQRVGIIIILTLIAAGLLAVIMSNWEAALARAKESENQMREAFDEVSEMRDDLEKRVQERTADLINVNKELESFAYSVSHDLKAPLRAIIGFSEILDEEYIHDLPEEAQEHMSRVLNNSKLMDNLIDDFLQLSRASRKELTRQTIQLNYLAEQVYNSLIDTSSGRQFNFISTACPEIRADLNLMRILLTNLISNALKFTQNMENSRIEFGCLQRDQVVFFLRDNGIGFDQKHANLIFEPFQRLHAPKEYEGSGIGLAIVKRIIHRHQGRIWVESELGQGSTFFFTLG
jgi:signal transduction histidine kinase